MKKFFYFLGRAFQLIGLLALPSAIWVAEFQKSEAGAVTILLASIGIFFLGSTILKVAQV